MALWAIHRLGGTVTYARSNSGYALSEDPVSLRCSNPHLKTDEVTYQLNLARVTFMIVHSSALSLALEAATSVGLPIHRIILLDCVPLSLRLMCRFESVQELILMGERAPRQCQQYVLQAGEGTMKVALLCWSSGTTGKPKVLPLLTRGRYSVHTYLTFCRPWLFHITHLLPIFFRWQPTTKWADLLLIGKAVRTEWGT